MNKMTADSSYQRRMSTNCNPASGWVKLDELVSHPGLPKSTVSRALNG